MNEEEPHSRKTGAKQNYRLPPIHSPHRTKEDTAAGPQYQSSVALSNNGTAYSEAADSLDMSAENTTTTSGVFSYSPDDRDRASPDKILQVLPRHDNGHKVVALPVLGASGVGQIFAHRSYNPDKIFEVSIAVVPGSESYKIKIYGAKV